MYVRTVPTSIWMIVFKKKQETEDGEVIKGKQAKTIIALVGMDLNLSFWCLHCTTIPHFLNLSWKFHKFTAAFKRANFQII